jgi:hypothetical protein
MPAKIDSNSVFGNALPMAYIRKVSLLEGVISEEQVRQAHNHPLVVSEKNFFGKIKLKDGEEEERKKDAISAARRRRIVEGHRGLTIDVELSLKDVITGHGTSTWYGNDNIKEHMKIRVLLCRHRKTGNRLSTGGLTPKAIARLKKTGKIIEKIIDIGDEATSPIRRHRRERVENITAYSVPYSVSFSINQYRPDYLAVFAMTFLETGEAVVRRQAFNRKSRITLQGNASMEVLLENGALKSFASVFTTPQNKVWAGPIHFHSERGPREVQKKGSQRIGGQRRAGRKRKGKYMTGAFHSQRQHAALERKDVPNIIVHDYRLLDDMKKADLQLHPDHDSDRANKRRKRKGAKKERNKTPERNKIPTKESYVSPLYSSRSPTNASKFAFHLDLEKLIRLKGQYGKIFEIADRKAKMSILSKTKIKNIRILRHRVLTGIHRDRHIQAPFETRTELVAVSSDPKGRGMLVSSIRQSYPDATTTEADPKTIGAIKEIKISGRSDNLRFFTVSDYHMRSITDGLYQYSVEADIEDGTLSFVEEQLNKLSKARTRLQQYYNLSMKPENYNHRANRSTRRFEREMKKTYPIPRRSEIMSGRKIDRSRLVKNGISRAPWIRSAAVYVDVLFNMSNLSERKARAASSLLYEMSSPHCGNPTGTLSVIEMMEQLENKIKSVLRQKTIRMDELNYYSTGGIVQGSAVTSSKNSRPSMSLRHRFKEVYDSDILKGVGYDFLGGKRKKEIGIRNLPLEKFRQRVLSEQKKHFNPRIAAGAGRGQSDFDLQTFRPSYLAPAKLSTGRKRTFNFLRGAFSRRLHQNAMNAVLSLKPTAGNMGSGDAKTRLIQSPNFGSNLNFPEDSPIGSEEYEANVMTLVNLSKLGVSIIDSDTYDKKHSFLSRLKGKGEFNKGKISIADSFGNLNISTDDEDEEEISNESLNIKVIEKQMDLAEVGSAILSQYASSAGNLFSETSKIKTIDQFNVNNDEKNIVKKLVARRPDMTFDKVVSRMPNQIKSLFMQNNRSTTQNFLKTKRETGVDVFAEPSASPMLYFNYQMLNRIEVFVGYGRSKTTGERQLKQPKFRLLTDSVLKEVAAKNKFLLCRMMPYSNSMLGFGHKDALTKGIPIFDQYFLISPRKRREEGEDLQPDTNFVGRVSSKRALNNVGIQALENLVNISMLENSVMPEYLMTSDVQQPPKITKTGTEFGKEDMSAKGAIGDSVSTALDSLSDGETKSRRRKTGRRGGRGRTGGSSGMGGSY